MLQTVTTRDARLIITARGIRQCAYGQLAVVLAVALSRDGFSPFAIGALVTVSLLGDMFGTIIIGRYADSWGRRRTLMLLALLMALTGLVFCFSTWYPLLLIAAFFGTLGTTASETAPFLPLEQAMLPQTIPETNRTAVFAWYNLVASGAGAIGGLVATLPDAVGRLGISQGVGIKISFLLYTVFALVVIRIVQSLSPSVESPPMQRPQPSKSWWSSLIPPLGQSRTLILTLSALFSVDALAGGLVSQTLLALFFHLRFGVSLTQLGLLFFGANLLSALSFLGAAPLARRFGLLNTMVFTHLPSNVFLLIIAFMPTFPLAALFLFLRQLLSQMDVPTRQAYTMALVAPEERTASASITSLARSTGSASSPLITGALLQGSAGWIGAPFLLAGGIKVIYDLALWRLFSGVPLPQSKEPQQP